jgi:hypothetical protein
MRKDATEREIEQEMQNRRAFLDFLMGLLRFNPLQRWTPQQALQHPYITQKPFVEQYNPLNRSAPPSPLITRMPPKPHADIVSPSTSKPSPALRKAIQNTKEPLPYQNMMTVFPANMKPISVQDSQYQQVVGTFSEFKINSKTGGPSSLPDNGVAHRQSISEDFKARANPHMDQFPIRKAKSNFAVGDSYGSLPQHQLQSFQSNPDFGDGITDNPHGVEIQPRHGNFGERTRIPSRIPSVSSSIDWEPFKDYDVKSYAGSFASSSYRGSRQNSMSDMGPLSYSVEHSRRASQITNSPGQQRQLGFPTNRLANSFSQESFGSEDIYGRSPGFSKASDNFPNSYSESYAGNAAFLGQRLAMSSNNGQRGHKKQKSISSLPQKSPNNSASRRPSVPNNNYTPPQGSYSNMQSYSKLSSSENRPSLLELNPTLSAYAGASSFKPNQPIGAVTRNIDPITGLYVPSEPIDLPQPHRRNPEGGQN